MTDTTTQAALPQILPCPFCGHETARTLTAESELWAAEHDEDEPFPHSESWQVICDASHPGGPGGCGAGGGFKPSEAAAVQAWNQRSDAALASLTAERDELRALLQWHDVRTDGLPPCDGEVVFIGINSAGYVGAFNEHSGGGCYMETAEGTEHLMGDLRYWRRHTGPVNARKEGD